MVSASLWGKIPIGFGIFLGKKQPTLHFLIKKEKILLVLTPLGCIRGVGGGFSSGTYMVVDRQTGELGKRGRYQFPEDSLVFFEDGRIVGFLLDEEGGFTIQALAFEGF